MRVPKSRLTRIALASLLALSAGGVYTARGYAQEEGDPDDGSDFSGKCRIWCVTHERHELINCTVEA